VVQNGLIAFGSHPGDLFVVNVDGKGRLRLTEDEAENRDPSWQPLAG
jgi:Tol biopolymer transport system component